MPDAEADLSGVVTILFTDLVGSTELLGRLGEDRADEIRRAHFSLLRAAIAAHDGAEVKNIGDSLMVAFSSPARAVACAIEIQQRIDVHRRGGGPQLRIRIGINAGEATQEDGDYFGMPVVVARRLCDRAEGDQILASDVVRALVGSRGGFTFKDVGALPLKGIDDPVPAAEVRWEPLEGGVPLPSAISADPSLVVGRDTERAALREAFARAAGGARVLVMLGGEPGIGKTTLAFDLAREAHAGGATVLYGRCEDEAPVPYQPFAEALAHYARYRPEELRATGTSLARVVPGFSISGAQGSGDPESERFLLFEAVRSALDAAASSAPVLLVLDDLHWADKTTLLLLRHLARAPEAQQLLILGTYRDVELDRRHPLADALADLRRDGAYERILLRGLSQEEVASYLEGRAGHALDDDGLALAGALHRETEGNPFFIREIVRHLVETGAIVLKEGRWMPDRSIDDVGLPESVREVIGRRLSRLSDPCGEVLAIASVIGRDFDLRLLAGVTDRAEDDLADLLDEAVGARGVVDEMAGTIDRFTFAHALVHETLYGELTTTRRVRLHRRVGEAIELLHAGSLDPPVAELARHFFEAAAAGTAAKAVDYARAAGRRAIEKLAFEDAAAHLDRALYVLDGDVAPDEVVLCDLLIETADAHRLMADLRGTRELAARAGEITRRRGWPERLARAALTYGGLWIDVALVSEEQLALINDAIAALPADDPLVPMLYARLAMEMFAGDPADLERYSLLAVESARLLGDTKTLAYALVARRHAVSGPHQLEERLAITEEAIRIADEIGEPDLGMRARAFRIIEQVERGAIEDADREYAEFFRRAEELRQPIYLYLSELFRAGIALREGALDGLEDDLRRVSDWARRQGRITALIASATQRMTLHYLRGTMHDLDQEAIKIVNAFSAQIPLGEIFSGWHLWAVGDEVAARAKWEHVLEQDLREIPRTWVFMPLLVYAVDLAGTFGPPDALAAIVEMLEPFADLVAVAGATALVETLGPVRGVLGLACARLGRLDESAGHYEAAIPIAERMRDRPSVVRARAELASVLVARAGSGDRERVRALLDAALSEADVIGLGAPWVVDGRSRRRDLDET